MEPDYADRRYIEDYFSTNILELPSTALIIPDKPDSRIAVTLEQDRVEPSTRRLQFQVQDWDAERGLWRNAPELSGGAYLDIPASGIGGLMDWLQKGGR